MDPRLDLEGVIRPRLTRMEDVLIFDLFERMNFKVNEKVYLPGAIEICPPRVNHSDYFEVLLPPDIPLSFLDFLLKGIEEVEASAGRFTHPDERPFFQNSVQPIVAQIYAPTPIRPIVINENDTIKRMYLNSLQLLCQEGDDGHYGSSATADIKCLKDLSARIHQGAYVAESKFQTQPEVYSPLIVAGDRSGIFNALTNRAVENEILGRVREKGVKYKLDSIFIEDFFRDKVIPLTKRVEVEYLMHRGTEKNGTNL